MAASGSRDNLIAAALVGTVVVVLGYASGIGVRPSQAGDQPVIALPSSEPSETIRTPAPTTPTKQEEEPDDETSNDDESTNHTGPIVDPGEDTTAPGEPNPQPTKQEPGPSPSVTPTSTSTLPPPPPTSTSPPPTCPPGVVESLPVVGPVVGPVVQPVLDPLQAALLGETTCLLVAP